jgi:hypothetical protein
MCETTPGEVQETRPRPAPGAAVDPIALEPVDEVEILTLVDNVFDALLSGELEPSLVAPGHCTGWRAQHALAAALPDAWVQSSTGTTYRLGGETAA